MSTAPERLGTAQPRVGLQRLDGARFADKHDERAAPGEGLVEGLAQPLQLLLPPDKDASGKAFQRVRAAVAVSIAPSE